MNRRKFLSGTSVALVATGGLGSSRFLLGQTSGPNPAIYNAGTAANSIATGNALITGPSPSDWMTIGNTVSSVLADWRTNNNDAALESSYQQLTVSQISSATQNQAAILANIQLYQPTFTLANLQSLLAILNGQPVSTVQQVITNLQTTGMVPYLNTLISESAALSLFLVSLGKNPPGGPVKPLPGAYRPAMGQSSFRTAQYDPSKPAHLLDTTYSCATDGALILAATLAVATLAVMSGGTIFLLAGWGAVALWGGTATAAWGAGHVIAGCGF